MAMKIFTYRKSPNSTWLDTMQSVHFGLGRSVMCDKSCRVSCVKRCRTCRRLSLSNNFYPRCMFWSVRPWHKILN